MSGCEWIPVIGRGFVARCSTLHHPQHQTGARAVARLLHSLPSAFTAQCVHCPVWCLYLHWIPVPTNATHNKQGRDGGGAAVHMVQPGARP